MQRAHPQPKGPWLATGLLVLGVLSAARAQQTPTSPAPQNTAAPAPAGPVTADARAADTAEFVSKLGAALRLSLTANPFGGRRITLHCVGAPVSSVQAALAHLYRTTWSGGGSTQALDASSSLDAASDRLR